LHGLTHTGVTIQTLSPRAFDEGNILLQTPRPGLPVHKEHNFVQLRGILSLEGARLLVEALRMGLHVPPDTALPSAADASPASQQGQFQLQQQSQPDAAEEQVSPLRPIQLRRAPKIVPLDRQVQWLGGDGGHGHGISTTQASPNDGTTHAATAVRRERALGSLWTHILPWTSSPAAAKQRQAEAAAAEIQTGDSGGSSSTDTGPEGTTAAAAAAAAAAALKPKLQPKRVFFSDISVYPFAVASALRRGPSGGGGGDAAANNDTGATTEEGKRARKGPLDENDAEGFISWLQQARRQELPDGEIGERRFARWDGRYVVDEDRLAVLVEMRDGSWLRVGRIKVEGEGDKPASRVLRRFRRRTYDLRSPVL
jgi:methionyl-tRNA formyltransferase